MPEPGDVVTVKFIGAVGTKRRPAVVVSSHLYVVGHLSERDWHGVQSCLTRAIAVADQ